MPKRNDLTKILVIGSGPIVIGQAAEFDYSGTQAALALKEEGYSVVLVNSNPATIMTDTDIADHVYMEPLTVPSLEKIIATERPQALIPTIGGQKGLNLAKELSEAGVLAKYDVELLGTALTAIEQAEDREAFRDLMQELSEPVPESVIANDVDTAVAFSETIGYPVIVRPAYTLGGTGGGIAHDKADLVAIVTQGLLLSPVTQVLIEKSIAGYKEIEFEVMRDAADNALIVASMENVDPVGVHTGDSIVVSPVQTLTDRDYQRLRDAALKIIRALDIAGGVNIQMALDPYSDAYYIIEVNPRVSRSSALASKATGYPIAKMAAKIAVGWQLDELINPVTTRTTACFEPALDYVVVKIPRWPFDKFVTADRTLGTQMKATGEVMAIGRSFEEALLKAVRSLEIGRIGLLDGDYADASTADLLADIAVAKDDRLFVLATLLQRGCSVDELASVTKINRFFLHKIAHIIKLQQRLVAQPQDTALLAEAKYYGLADATIAQLWQTSEEAVRAVRIKQCPPVYKMVDTAAGEFAAATPYFYSTHGVTTDAVKTAKPSVLVIGSGPIRIGQGVEFDYATVHAVKAIQEAGYEAIVVNSNPETVSTDFSISDKLYFEPLTLEDVLNVIAVEQPVGVVVQFGGQTAINLAAPLAAAGVNVLGTSVANLARAEDRQEFEECLVKLAIAHPQGKTVRKADEAQAAVAEVGGYPVLVRPSFVLGGRAMAVIDSDEQLATYIAEAVSVSDDQPILIDRYLPGSEAECDVISDGDTVVVPGIMTHIERSGVHSGDSFSVYPPQHLAADVQEQMVTAATALAKELQIVGCLNVQFVIHQNTAYVIEVNPRASRTVPFMSKVTDVPMAQLATRAMLGDALATFGYQTGLLPEIATVAVKAPVFSFSKLLGMDIRLRPEMMSTGEAIGQGATYVEAVQKACTSADLSLAKIKRAVVLCDDQTQEAVVTAALAAHGITAVVAPVTTVATLTESYTWLRDEAIDAVISDVPVEHSQLAGNLRTAAVQTGKTVVSSLDTLDMLLSVTTA